MNKPVFKNIIKPVIVLLVICIIASLSLAVTNEISAPLIEEANRKAANASRFELLSTADDFEQIEVTNEGVVDFYKATNDVGFVITATAKGYGGEVPVMIAFNTDGTIVGLNVLTNNETPGLGKKVEEDSFEAQFKDKTNENITIADIDAISGATISSSAVVQAVNYAITAFNEVALGEVVVEKTNPEKAIELLPTATSVELQEITATQMDIEITANDETKTYPLQVDEVYLADTSEYIVFAQGVGYHDGPVFVTVAFDNAGTVVALNIDGSKQTAGLGSKIGEQEFISQFVGKTAPVEGVDVVAQATISSEVAIKLVDLSYQSISPLIQNDTPIEGGTENE